MQLFYIVSMLYSSHIMCVYTHNDIVSMLYSYHIMCVYTNNVAILYCVYANIITILCVHTHNKSSITAY